MLPKHDIAKRFIHKTVEQRFAGRTLSFGLSQSLFSGYKIDDGTRLLLKTLVQSGTSSVAASVLDLGCGIGTIGLCLASARPDAQVLAQDRDSLAACVTEYNAEQNGLKVATSADIAFRGCEGRRFDLIVSNIPAKASEPVFRDWVRRSALHLTPSGLFAVVVVEPLRQIWSDILAEYRSEIMHEATGPGHHVFIFKPSGDSAPSADPMTPYMRRTFTSNGSGADYSIETVYGLPEFDTLGYQTGLAFESLGRVPVNGKVLLWNPGAGHLAAFLARKNKGIRSWTLASRDALALEITGRNLARNGTDRNNITSLCVPSFTSLDGGFDLICLMPDDDPGSPEAGDLLPHAARLLSSDGHLLLSGPASRMNKLGKEATLRRVSEEKKRGFISVLSKKNG
jgi:16S rRNA G1207 methylase RsmC